MRPKTAALLADIVEAGTIAHALTIEIPIVAFVTDRRNQLLMERVLDIVGEAIRQLSHEDPAQVERLPNPRGYINLRNIISHQYARLEYETLWSIASERLPALLDV